MVAGKGGAALYARGDTADAHEIKADLFKIRYLTPPFPNHDRRDNEVFTEVAAARFLWLSASTDPSARSLRRGSTRTLGIVMGEHLTYAFEDPQAVSFLAGIADVCAPRGYGMTILPITGCRRGRVADHQRRRRRVHRVDHVGRRPGDGRRPSR